MGPVAESLSVGEPKLTIRIPVFFPPFRTLEACGVPLPPPPYPVRLGPDWDARERLVRGLFSSVRYLSETISFFSLKNRMLKICAVVRRKGTGVARATPAASYTYARTPVACLPRYSTRRICGALGPPALVHKAFFFIVPLPLAHYRNLFLGESVSKLCSKHR